MHRDNHSFLTLAAHRGLLTMRVLAVGALVLSVAAVPALALDAPSPEMVTTSAASFTMMPGVVVDPAAKVVYSMGAEGQVEALALADGRLLWTSQEAARPLVLFGNYLIAQRPSDSRGIFELAFLAVDRDGALVTRSSVSLGSDVDALIDDRLGREFRVDARVETGVPVLHWTYEVRRITGADPSLVPDADRVDRYTGRLRFDSSSETWTADAGAVGGVVARRPDLAAEERVPDVAGTQFRSADDAHVMTSDRVADGRVFERYQWNIRSREDGVQRGEIRSFVSWAPHFVSDTVLVAESPTHQVRVADEMTSQPRRLVAFDLRNGRTLWDRPVRDLTYYGPFPP